MLRLVHAALVALLMGTVQCRWGYWGYGDTYDKVDNEAAYDAILSTSVNFWDTGQRLE